MMTTKTAAPLYGEPDVSDGIPGSAPLSRVARGGVTAFLFMAPVSR